MKKTSTLIFVLIAFLAIAGSTSCKSKSKQNNDSAMPAPAADTSASTTPVQSAPEISTDDALKTGVTDALKDYPSVKGEVSEQVIVLTGDIKRADWQKLMPTLNSLHPKRINSTNLTIK